MASIWDFLDSLPKRSDVTPEELARRRQGYADLYQGGLLAGNRNQMPLSVQGAQATQDFLPVIGDALALGEAGEALSRGELAAAGLLGAGAAIGLVPAAGDALAKPVMAAGRRAADIARRIEVDPNALGSMGGNIRLSPENVSPAQEVAGLLSSGRADEVTDEMLAKFTPRDKMELFDLYQRGATGMDLPMDEASRMARARDMGFDTDLPLYHGTGADFQSFDAARFQQSDFGTGGAGVYSSEAPSLAGAYADLVTRPSNDNANILPIVTRRHDAYDTGGYRNINNYEQAREYSRRMQDLGVDNVYYRDNMSGEIVENVTFDPSNVRSRFARFDPRLAHLRNLSAGVGGLGLLSSMMPSEEQY